MRKSPKVWIVAAVVAGLAVIAFVLWRQHAGPVQVAEVLSARDTVALVAVGPLAEVVQHFDQGVAKALPDLAKSLPALDPVDRKKRLGFDPATPEGWASIGVDPQAGLAVTFDVRVLRPNHEPAPLFLVRFTDKRKFAAFLGQKLGKPVDFGSKDDGVRVIDAAGQRLATATLHGWTAVLLPVEAAELDAMLPAFKTFAAMDGPRLADDPAFTAGLHEAPDAPRLIAWTGVEAATALAKQRWPNPTVLAGLEHAGKLVRALGYYATPEGTMGARLVATADGVHALQQILRPAKASPDLAAHVPGTGWAALRLSVNLKEVFDGLGSLLPPSLSEAKAGLGMARAFMPMMVGFAWDDVSHALSGHVLVAVQQSGAKDLLQRNMQGLDWRALFAVQDGPTADALLGKIAQSLKKRGMSATAVKGGWQVEVAGQTAVVVRVDDLLVCAPTLAAVDAAVQQKAADSLAATAAGEALGDSSAFGLALDGGGGKFVTWRLALDGRGLALAMRGDMAAAGRMLSDAASIFLRGVRP